MAEGAVEAEAAEWAEAMVLILEGNVNSIDTVAATGRKCFFFLWCRPKALVLQIYTFHYIHFAGVYVEILMKVIVSVV